jgi:hypothetical protein
VKGEVLGTVYRVIAGHLVKKAGETLGTARAGAVTLVRRFGGAVLWKTHFGMPRDGSFAPLATAAPGRVFP